MNAWKNNNLLPTDKETFIDVKMNNLMNFLNAEDLSSNDEIVSNVHLNESINLKEATDYNPKTYNFAASQFHMTLDELEGMVKTNVDRLNALVAQDAGIQKRYSGVVYSKKQWLQKINYLRRNIEFYKPEKFRTQYVKGYRSITLNKYLDFNQEQPGICWAWSKNYQQKNEKNFIIQGTGNGSRYLLRLKAAFKNSDIDWVKTVYLIKNDEGELRLHPDGKAYILDKLIYSLEDKNNKELGVENVSDFERKYKIGLPLILSEFYNPKTQRYDIDSVQIDLSMVYKDGEFLVPIGTWSGDLKVSNLKSFKNGPTKVLGNFYCDSCNTLTSLKGAPGHVGGDFDCCRCNNLTSLEGAPEYVEGVFCCMYCENLTSLEGAPEKISKDFKCGYCNSLISLKGAPKEVDGDFICTSCSKLESLIGAPEHVGGNFRCFCCDNLTSLKGAPKHVGKCFDLMACGRKFTEDEIRAICNVKGKIYC